ncbi:MAG: TraM recognition domain-containing protein [Pseudomonadota bacterium]
MQPIWAPNGHSLLLSAAGGGKTTSGAMPWLYSCLTGNGEPNPPAILALDSKGAELTWQTARMAANAGRKVAVIDDCGELPDDFLHKVKLNPMGSLVGTYQRDRRDLIFASEGVTRSLIPEPEKDERNLYWRDEPRTLIEFATFALLRRNPKLAIPGGVWALLSDPEMLREFAQIEAEEDKGLLRVLAVNVLAMTEHEHFAQHRSAATRALRIFALSTRLHSAGNGAELTHYELIKQGYVIYLVGPQEHMNRLGSYYALHIMAFNAALYQGAGPLIQILDEFTNCPLKPMVEAMTTLRAFGAQMHMIAQSRSEIERKFGKLEVETIEENAIVKQYFGFSSFSEAERISKAIGEEQIVNSGVSADNKETRLQFSYQSGKERNLTPASLLAMPKEKQLIHVKGIGFINALKIGQQNVAPWCNLIANNPLEGGPLEPDPWIELIP